MPGLSGSGGVSWYDLLGVPRDASPEAIKAAWREATDKFEPGAGTSQFRLFNEAADVLLDPARRTAYDAELGAGEDRAAAVPLEPPREPAPTPEPEPEPAPEPARGRSSGPVPVWLMSGLALLCVLVVVLGGVLWQKHHTYGQRTDAGQEATAAAERALPVILSYDYRHLSADRDHAARFLTPKYKKEYTSTFDKLIESTGKTPGPAEQTKAVVKATVQDIGVVAAEPDVVKVIVFLDQSTVKASGAPKYSLNRLTVSMVRSGNAWLVDNINSY